MLVPSAPLFLVGMMGAGKSSVGRRVADGADAPFVDLDRRIESLFGSTVAELFQAGEPHFRACERQALHTLLREPGFAGRACVVATGGGVVLDPDNVAAMRASGVVVYLEVPPEELAMRLQRDTTRPLLSGAPDLLERVKSILTLRAPAYQASGTSVPGDGDAEHVVSRVESIWEAV